ncbi:hypothetical protein [uncultured Psychrobacter sp.]|uniref:hypothetical protein n=1 Tax=uncultured Psychrobacter sp. TaxID=259303 RepID=UPI002635914D|nr:hypothetical protein [uncultured Psychrobacter sp.]
MSIESGITKIAEALGAVAQAGNAIAASIDRYVDATTAEVVKVVDNDELNEVINKAVADFEAEHDEPKADAEQSDSQASEVEDVTAEETSEAVEETANAESDEPVTFEEAKTVVIDTVAAKGKPAVAAIFKQLGAKNLPELEPSQYGELVALCKAA